MATLWSLDGIELLSSSTPLMRTIIRVQRVS